VVEVFFFKLELAAFQLVYRSQLWLTMLAAFVSPVGQYQRFQGQRVSVCSRTRHNVSGRKRIFRAPIVCEAEHSKLPLRTGVLVSGSGRSLENICQRIQVGRLTGIDVNVVIASKASAGALKHADRFGIEYRVIRPVDYDPDSDQFSDAISRVLHEFRVDLVVLAGWMHFYRIPDEFANKVVNIHPSLIPAFCGKGYYGHRVHEAVVRRSLQFLSYIFVSIIFISNDAKRDSSTNIYNILSMLLFICDLPCPLPHSAAIRLQTIRVHSTHCRQRVRSWSNYFAARSHCDGRRRRKFFGQ
jgi:Formyl transferase